MSNSTHQNFIIIIILQKLILYLDLKKKVSNAIN